MFFCFNFGMLVPLLVLVRLDMAFKPVSFGVNICTIAWVTISAEVSLKQRQGKAGEYVQQHCRDGFNSLVFLMKERFKITLRSSRCISHNGLIMVVLKCSILVAHPARLVEQVCAIRSPACCRYPARTILQVSCGERPSRCQVWSILLHFSMLALTIPHHPEASSYCILRSHNMISHSYPLSKHVTSRHLLSLLFTVL